MVRNSLLKHWVIIWFPLAACAFLWKILASPLLFFGHDGQSQQYPWKVFAYNSIARGELPLWNPHVMLGVPFVEGMQSAIFYPPHLLLLAMPAERAMALLMWLHFAIAGIGMYAAAYRIGRHRPGALLAGTCFMLGGLMTTRIVAGHFSLILQVAWLPWIFLCANICVDGGRGAARWACAAGVLWGMGLLTGHPQFPYYEMIFIGAYIALGPMLRRRIPQAHIVRDAFARVAVFAVCGVAVSLPQILPSLEFLAYAARSKAGYVFATSGSFPAAAWLGLIVPMFFGDEFFMAKWGYWSYWETCAYIGLAPLFLAAAAIFSKRKSGVEAFLLAAGGAAFILAIGRYLFFYKFLFRNVPLLSDFRAPARALLIFYFCASLLAGLWLARPQWRLGRGRTAPLYIACACWAVIAALLWFSSSPKSNWDVMQDRFVSTYMRKEIGPELMADGKLHSIPDNPARANAEAAAGIALALNTAFIFVFIIGLRRPRRDAFFHTAVIILATADLFALGWRYVRTYELETKYKFTASDTAILDSCKEPYRIITTSAFGRFANTGMASGIDAVGGYDTTITKWFNEYYNFVKNQPRGWINSGNLSIDEELPPGFAWLNVRYVLDARWRRPTLPGVKRVALTDKMRVFVNRRTIPRAFIVHTARFIPSERRMMSLLTRKGYDPRRVIYLSAPLDPEAVASGVAAGAGKPAHLRPPKDSVEFISRAANEVTIRATARNSGFLFLSDAYYPHWRAFVDGNETEILRANYLCRAVFVSAGKHIVKFKYEEPLLAPGLIAGILCLLAFAPFVATAGRRR